MSYDFAYFRLPPGADPVFEDLWSYLEVIQRETGYVTYDPQLEQVVALDGGKDAIIARYCGVSDNLEQLVLEGLSKAEPSGPQKRPWWKFW